MPGKSWTSQDDFEAWAWTGEDLDTTPGSVLIATGETMAEGLSPVYECASYLRHTRCVIAGSAPEGTTILLRYRVGATESACGEAVWSGWFNGLRGDGDAHADLLMDMLNREIDPTGLGCIQYQVRLYSE